MMGFRLVAKSLTLGDIERRKPLMAIVLRYCIEFDSVGANCVKVDEDGPISCATKM